MTTQFPRETQQLVKFIEKQAFADEDKKRWTEFLTENGLDQEILEEVHKKFLEIPKESFANDWQRAQNNMEFTKIQKQWRLDQASRNFKRSR
ncbi:hypothetical protein SDC9_180179 [bioreactor metagenome]|jgi:hypothetical protein|uniref:Uncharacterized protein n=1 Tax=bioreactor metagenome TaxID=1076179 RepID=A0A645H3X6_9ZZZZ